MYFMPEDEITWTNISYSQFQIYEHRLNNFIDRSWPMSLYQNEGMLAEAWCSIQEIEILWFVHFLEFIFTDGHQRMIHLQNTKILIRIVNSCLYFKILLIQLVNATLISFDGPTPHTHDWENCKEKCEDNTNCTLFDYCYREQN